jgi:hypothetical protein
VLDDPAGSVLALLRSLGREHQGLTVREVAAGVWQSEEDRARKRAERELRRLEEMQLVECAKVDTRDGDGRKLPSRWRVTAEGAWGGGGQ